MPINKVTMAKKVKVDICVYGGTSGGVVAAIAAAQQGRNVILIETGRHLGGMSSGGLGLTDHGRKEAIGGLSREFYRRVAEYYRRTGTPASEHQQGEGWTHEPHVAEQVFNQWINETAAVVVFEYRVSSVIKDGTHLRSIILDHAPPDERGAPAAAPLHPAALCVEAAVFIDASYEGDLMMKAGVTYTTRREARGHYNESLAGICRQENHVAVDPYTKPGHPETGLLPLLQADDGSTDGDASACIQAYNFRLCLSQTNIKPIEPPANYDPFRYELFGREIEAFAELDNPLEPHQIYHYPANEPPYIHPRVLKMSPVPNGKTDVNNCVGSTDFIGGGSTLYPDADWPTRARIRHAHEDYIRGLFHFLRTDTRVSPAVRAEVAKWGLPNDEFRDSGGWPHQLYIRESRRMLGEYVMTQKDCEAPSINDSIGLGSYPLDSHICQRLVRNSRIILEGSFYEPIADPYPISYRALVPRTDECRNLLVLFCLSSSHAAYSSLRMEPVLMILGQSAAAAACQAIEESTSVQCVDVPLLQNRLRVAGQILEYQK